MATTLGPVASTKKKKILPRGKYILIKPAGEAELKNDSGLLIPNSVEKEQRAQGTVEAVGSEIKDIKVGDEVVYGVYAGETIKTRESGKEIERKLLHDDDVIALIK